MSLERDIPRAVKQAIEERQTPGAVVLVGKGDEVVYHEAFGNRSEAPETLPMQPDTVFDLASITKPVATATSMMQLVERGDIVLKDPVSRFIPQFTGDGRENATIRHLLTHSAGLQPYHNYLNELGSSFPSEERRPRVVQELCEIPLQYQPGEGFTYTCLGYILLASVVQAASGQPLDEFAAENTFGPLGMTDTCFNPPDELKARCAATEQLPEGVLLGVVHDENARFLNGVGGNAGLFSTALDLSRYARAILNDGEFEGARILSPTTVALMTSAQSDVVGGVRGLGWDIQSDYSPPLRGDLLPVGSFGHGGYTGGSLWFEPDSGVYIIILANRVHYSRETSVLRLRRQIANTVAANLLERRPRFTYKAADPVRVGLDVIKQQGFATLPGRKIGLVSNHTAIDQNRGHLLDALLMDEGVQIGAILSPEHGFAGMLDEKVPSGSHETGIPIHSLYGEHQSPTPEMLEGLDCLLYDIADVGLRFYTYTTTMVLCMKAAAEADIDFVVLDRPNPIDGLTVEGPELDEPFRLLSSWHPIPLRHGLTSGELALWSNERYEIDCRLQVVKCEGWRRDMWFDECGLPWIDPSPNMRNLKQAILYPVTGTLEATNISVGRGTDTPFELFGAPWMDGERLARRLNALEIPELSFIPIQFTPDTREFVGELCEGVYIMLGDRLRLRTVDAAVQIACLLRELWPDTFEYEKLKHLIGSNRVVEMVGQMRPAEEIIATWQDDVRRFYGERRKYLIYD